MEIERKTVILTDVQGRRAVSQPEKAAIIKSEVSRPARPTQLYEQLRIDDELRRAESSQTQPKDETPAEMYARYLGGTALPSDKFGLLF